MMPESKDPTVNIGEFEVVLRAPKSRAIAWDIVAYQGLNPVRAGAAALAACWRGKGAPKASYALHSYSVGAFGGAVMDELLERGVAYSDIVAHGQKALAVLTRTVVTANEVDDAEGFSEADGAESTG